MLKAKDIILSINGLETEDAYYFKSISKIINTEEVALKVLRAGKVIELVAATKKYNYPYIRDTFGKYYFPFGIITNDGINMSYIINKIEEILKQHNIKSIMVVVSPLLFYSFDIRLRNLGYSTSDKFMYTKDKTCINLLRPRNYFFGGNIDILDMITIYDIKKSIEINKVNMDNIDIIVTPSTFLDENNYDLAGVNIKVLSHIFQKPIEVIHNNYITF